MKRTPPFLFFSIISALIHVLILFSSPNAQALKERRLLAKEITVTYQKFKDISQKERALFQQYRPELGPKIASAKDLPLKVKNIEPLLLKERFYQDLKITADKKPLIPKSGLNQKKVSLPELEQPQIKNPLYLSYYQDIRARIKHFAYSNYTRLEKGEIYMTFIISSDGSLKDIKVLNDKSTDSPYLKGISLKSVKEATPYPNFPKELNYPQLSFNVIISYEID
ncbi:MAG: hypothetical protein V1674_05195 [Candidatus Omnitrophota bacterium]